MSLDATRALMNELVDLGVKPHAEAIATICLEGDIAVAVYEPDLDDESVRYLVELVTYGQEGPVVRLPPSRAKEIFAHADAVTRKWMGSAPTEEELKIFLLASRATFLLNFSSERGFYLEPGSTDGEKTN